MKISIFCLTFIIILPLSRPYLCHWFNIATAPTSPQYSASSPAYSPSSPAYSAYSWSNCCYCSVFNVICCFWCCCCCKYPSNSNPFFFSSTPLPLFNNVIGPSSPAYSPTSPQYCEYVSSLICNWFKRLLPYHVLPCNASFYLFYVLNFTQ